MIQVKNLTFSYENEGEKPALKDVTFSLDRGTITAVLGPSGCGKSTLCQILCGIIPNCIDGSLSGETLLDGEPVLGMPLKDLSQKVGYMMQDPDRQIIASAVEDELAFGPENLMLPPGEIRKRVDAAMNFLGICHLAEKNPMQLSGGEKQLVAAGAVLTMEPEVLIMDEPLSHVDQEGRGKMLRLMKNMRDKGKTVIVVEHAYELLDFADRWVFLEEGRVRFIGSPAQMRAKGLSG